MHYQSAPMAYIAILQIILASICFWIGWWLNNRNAVLFNWPVLGMIPQLAANLHQFHEWSTKIAAKSKGTFLFKGPLFMNMQLLCTVDPVNIKHVMSTNFNNYPKGPEFREIFEVFGDGIFNADFDVWRYLRKTGTSVTNQDRFRKLLMKTTRAKVEKQLFEIVEHACDHGLDVDLQDVIHRFTLDTLFKMVNGHDPQSLNKEFKPVEFFKAMDLVEEAIFYRHVKPKLIWKLQRWIGFGQEKRMKIGWEILDRIVAEYITRKEEQLKVKDEQEESIDLLTKFLKEKEIRGPSFTNKFLRDSILNFMLAGRENSVQWFLWQIAKKQQVKDRIREELKSTLPTATTWPQFFESEKVNKLVYLHAAMLETLRLYPAIPYEHKEPLNPDVLPSGHYVDGSMKIFIPLYVMGRLKALWGDGCEEFKPERWISEEGKLIQHSSYKFMSFSAGPRTCMGKEMALIQMKALAAFIIHNYDYEVIEGHPVIPNYASIILHMKHGYLVKFSRRFD